VAGCCWGDAGAEDYYVCAGGGWGLVGASVFGGGWWREGGGFGEKEVFGGREGMDGEDVLSRRTKVLAFPWIVLVPG